MIRMKNKISHFDVAEYLDDEEMITLYLNEALDQATQDNNYNLVIEAIADIVKARGISKVALDAGIGRESLYKSLSPDAKPRYETISKLIHALGLKITVAPI